MNGISFTISVTLSLLGMFLSTRGRSDDVKFERYKEKGTEYKESGKFSAAMRFYKRALNHAGNERQKAKLWSLIVFLQTDRALAAHRQYHQNSGYKLTYTHSDGTEHFWFFHGSEPPGYKEPPRSEILK